MTPGLVNFVCPQGSTFRRTLTYTLDEVPVNLAGYSSRLQVREAYYSTDPLVSLVSGSGITMGGSAGTIDILISASVTSQFPTGTHVYDLEIISPSNIVDRLIEGTFNVTPEVTR
jgi:Na+/serine symporter